MAEKPGTQRITEKAQRFAEKKSQSFSVNAL
jgi:hypothetical protein